MRKASADCADFIIPTIEITTGKVKTSLLERADYADHSLLSGANLRNQRFPTTNYDINEAFFYERTDKICGIPSNSLYDLENHSAIYSTFRLPGLGRNGVKKMGGWHRLRTPKVFEGAKKLSEPARKSIRITLPASSFLCR